MNSYLNSERPVRWGPTWSWRSTHTSVALETCVPGVTADMLIHAQYHVPNITSHYDASAKQMLVWDPVLKRTRPQMTACVRARQLKGFTKDLLKCVWHLPVGNRIQAHQAGVKITDVRLLQGDRSHTCRHTHTHTPCGVSIGSSRLVTDDGIWQVVRRWFLFFQKGKRLKAGGLIISSLLTET